MARVGLSPDARAWIARAREKPEKWHRKGRAAQHSRTPTIA